MYPHLASDGWDFSPVLGLINSLSNGPSKTPEISLSSKKTPKVPSLHVHQSNSPDEKSGLGNFDKIWEFLAQPSSPPAEPLLNVNSASHITAANDVLDKVVGTSKLIKRHDATEGADLVGNDRIKEITSASSGKRHRRGRNRPKNTAPAPLGGVESEPEVDHTTVLVDRRSIIQQITLGPQTREKSNKGGLCPRDYFGTQSDPESLNRHSLRGSKSAALSSFHQTDYAKAAARKARLISKLHSMFINEQHYLTNFGAPSKFGFGTTNTDSAIHVFVDASNIMIGFQDALKLSRGIKTRIRRQQLSFHNLSLILERGRPASKKVLVGSDNFPAIQEAKLIGYEINILEKVHKARELSPRKKRNSYNSNGQSSGSETTAVMLGPERWVEQAVDEILHLKILESLIDAKAPSTIVLATGDGAEAEYSQGFLKMVERALEREWKVELVSFKYNTSNSYTKKKFRTRWGTNFRTIELDDFVEELLSA